MEFLLGILGLGRVERMAVASVCALTHSRVRGYAVLPPERYADADITLVEADNPDAREQWARSEAHLNGRPALMITRDIAQAAQQAYGLARAHFAARLLKTLDQIAIREFKFIPELVISDTSAAPAPGLRLSAAAKRAPPGGSLSALVVDDSVVVRTQMRTLLGLHGLHTDLAASAEEGLELMRARRYDIVFLDIVLPGVDGYAACRQMRGTGRHAPPIVMLTSRDSSFDKIRGVMAGCSRYLTKPIGSTELCKVLREFAPERLATPTDAD
jgi:twitching motility two-component system response regulator PilG